MPEPEPTVFETDPLTELDQKLIRLYINTGVTVDDLAYTPEFDKIFGGMKSVGDNRTQAEVFRRLLTLRKSGRLPRLS